eukprot:776931-Rhodomonas_salina.1
MVTGHADWDSRNGEPVYSLCAALGAPQAGFSHLYSFFDNNTPRDPMQCHPMTSALKDDLMAYILSARMPFGRSSEPASHCSGLCRR